MNFKDVTSKNPEVISVMRKSGIIHESIKIFERNNTQIIYSFSDIVEHASISNPNRKVRKSEVDYCIRKILKSKSLNMKIFTTSTGIIHIHQNIV